MKQSSDYLDFILDKFEALEVVSARKMFGGYVLHMPATTTHPGRSPGKKVGQNRAA